MDDEVWSVVNERINEKEKDGTPWIIEWPEIQLLGGEITEEEEQHLLEEVRPDEKTAASLVQKDDSTKSAVVNEGKEKSTSIKFNLILLLCSKRV